LQSTALRNILLIVNSKGLNFLSKGEWKRKKHQPEYRWQWRELHIGIDTKILKIRVVQLTTNNVSDLQVLDERIDSGYTDGAYDTKLCRQVISDRHTHTVIPPRGNARP
jgi:hypothetical protein